MTSQQTPAQQAETLEQLGEKRFTLAEWEATAKRVGNNINANLMKRVAEQAELITQLRAAVSGEGISLAAIAAGLTKYVVDNGAGHDDDCPADDTCECSQKFVNDAVNAACRVLNILSQLPLVAPQEDK